VQHAPPPVENRFVSAAPPACLPTSARTSLRKCARAVSGLSPAHNLCAPAAAIPAGWAGGPCFVASADCFSPGPSASAVTQFVEIPLFGGGVHVDGVLFGLLFGGRNRRPPPRFMFEFDGRVFRAGVSFSAAPFLAFLACFCCCLGRVGFLPWSWSLACGPAAGCCLSPRRLALLLCGGRLIVLFDFCATCRARGPCRRTTAQPVPRPFPSNHQPSADIGSFRFHCGYIF